MKRGTPRCAKMRNLAEYLDVDLPTAGGIMGLLWDWAITETPHGNIGKYSDRRIAESVCWKGDPGKLITSLLLARWIDPHDQHRLILHDWWEHCEDSVHQKLARQGQYFCDGRIPKLTRLSTMEREAVKSLYSHNEQLFLSAQKAPESALPSQAITKPSHLAAAEAAISRFPQAAAAIIHTFPTADAAMINKILSLSLTAVPDIDDAWLVEALFDTLKSKKGSQRSAALWEYTLPPYLTAKAALFRGRRTETPSPPTDALPSVKTTQEQIEHLHLLLTIAGVPDGPVKAGWQAELDTLLQEPPCRKPPHAEPSPSKAAAK